MGNEEKSNLEKKVMEGVYGHSPPKKEERNRFLGQYEERVIRYLTYNQVMKEGTYVEIEEALKRSEAEKLIIDRDVDLKYAHDYIKLAHRNKVKFRRVDSPDFRGDVALVVAAGVAVDINQREIMDSG